MAKSISIAVYSISLSAKKDPKKNKFTPIKYSEFKRGNKSYVDFVFEIIQETLNEYKNDDKSQEIAKIFYDEAVAERDENSSGINRLKNGLDGRLVYGKYGEIADIINTEDYQKSYRLSKKDAIVIPHYFYFYLPENSLKAYLCIQRYGNSGVFKILKKELEDHFKEKLDDTYRVKFKKLAPADYITQIDEQASRVTGITLSYHTEVNDIMDQISVDIDEVEKKSAKLEVEVVQIIRFKGAGKYLSPKKFAKEFLKKKKDFYVELDLPEKAQESENEIINVKYGNKNHRMQLETGKDLAAYFDISDSVKITDGLPELSDLRDAVNNIMEDVLKKTI